MIVAGSASPLLLSSAGGYNLTKSLRFRSSANAYLNRTFGTPTDTKKFTWSGWVKRGTLGAFQMLQCGDDGTSDNFLSLRFGDTDTLQCYQISGGSYNLQVSTSAVFRDPSAWYHIVFIYDSANATSTNRIQFYVNGVLQTVSYAIGPFAQNTASQLNVTSRPNAIGRLLYASVNYFDGYLAEVNFVDGQALTPSSFGQTSTTTGAWIPKKYTGTYGTNGFYLKFTDTTSTSTLGTDFSGNSNTWTVNNISLTSGSTYDSMNDVPTLTSATTANYWTLNPLNPGQLGTVQSGNLEWIAGDQSNFRTVAAPILPTSGKFYWEVQPIGGGGGGAFVSGIYIGIMNYANGGTGLFASGVRIADTGRDDFVYYSDGRKVNLNSFVSYGTAYVANDIIGVAVDIDNGKIWFSKNGVWQASGDPAAGTNAAYTTVPFSTKPYAPAMSAAEITNAQKFNFGQRPFTYTPPTGFVALNTFNLPTPTIGATASTQANRYMDVLTWTGNGASSRAITGLNFQPDWVWDKMRSDAYQHAIVDAVRGGNQVLHSNSTSAEDTNWAYGYVSSFNSNGFTIQAGSASSENWNLNGSTFVAWNWRASNATAVTNTAGSITSSVSANTTAGFSIVTYTGTGSNATVGHGLGVAPSMVIVKRRNGGSDNWQGYHISLGKDYTIKLNTTQAQENLSDYWGTGGVTSTVFGINGSYSGINANGGTYVAYCFAQVAGYSAFGSYTGNGSSDGPFVFLGFRPRWVMVKNITSAQSWQLMDTSRSTYNVATANLLPNSSSAELTGTDFIDMVSNGFKIRQSSAGNWNNSGDTYIYACFAENPFKYANAR